MNIHKAQKAICNQITKPTHGGMDTYIQCKSLIFAMTECELIAEMSRLGIDENSHRLNVYVNRKSDD